VLTIPMVQLFITELKASNVVRSGEIAISPGELPAAISDVLTRASIQPSMSTKPAKAVGLETLCEARTRVVNLLGGSAMVGPLPPQETTLKLATRSSAGKSASLFQSKPPAKLQSNF